ncbi:uncharacterized protein LOC143450754 [Clavelina lepadiformis]|uniref:uncharacterized protein LOC143450754 n=1 Tax=Clavelina lepadiformis TaxID=159417 RepID=UPI004042AAE2
MSDRQVDELNKLLQSEQKLERDKGIVHLKSFLKSSEKDKIAQALLAKFQENASSSNDSTPWEALHGCLLGVRCIIDNSIRQDDGGSVVDEAITDFFHGFALKCLANPEVRVRTEAGELLGALCKLKGSEVYSKSSDVVLNLLHKDLKREIEGDLHEEGDGRGSPTTSNAANIFHESAGWRYLETSMKCLQCMIEGCGKTFNPYITQELLNLLFSALNHTNRFVRETGYNVCAAIVRCGQTDGVATSDSVLKYGDQFSKYLGKGLADNWSQVRLASSVAVRNFLLSFPGTQEQEKFFPDLIPRMCLNRYYIAEGVRIYSQETWRQISHGHGKDIVEKYISFVVDYYIEATQADNHAVREAACACISELATKIKPEAVRDHVNRLLDALLECFQDDSWPVRDAACIACGNFILSFASEAKVKRDLLYSLFLENLKDPIPSVREGAGAAVAKYTKVYGDELLPIIIKEIQDGLEEVSNQPENSGRFTGLDKRPAQFGVVKNLHETSDPRHTDQQMYSCGSLAPKMGRGGRGGCSDCKFRRPSEPWERSDGCLYLIAELATYYPQKVTTLLPFITKALSSKQFSQHVVFLETTCKLLPTLASRIGKRAFKMHIETFFDAIFYALSSDVQLTVAAAQDCLIGLAKFLGASILRGRIENYNPHLIEQYDQIVMQRTQSPTFMTGKHSPTVMSGHLPPSFSFART